MLTREEYKKKIELCDKLGAKKFQKVVLKAEEIKFKVIKKVFPNFIVHYDKYCDRKRDKALKKSTNEEERKKVINECRNQKIAMRKELNREQNRNYHMDQNKPTEFMYYLNWNKKVHKKGLIRNIIAIAALSGALIFGISPALAVTGLVYEGISAFINFQCINIQNSHIYRFKILEESLIKREQNRNKSNLVNYSQAAKVYARSIEGTMDIPTLEQLIANVKTKEEAAELRKMIQTVTRTKPKRSESQAQTPRTQRVIKPQEDKTSPVNLADEVPQTISQINKAEQNITNIDLETMLIEQTNTEPQLARTEAVQKSIGGKK